MRMRLDVTKPGRCRGGARGDEMYGESAVTSPDHRLCAPDGKTEIII